MQTDGPSFTVDGHAISWQKWQLRISFNAKEGLVLHEIGYLDGGRVRLARPEPAERFVRALWKLLPDKARAGLWPASFAFGELPFDAAAMPAPPPTHGGLTEDGLKGYPAGNYEHRLQAAVEAGDERELAALLARRTGDDTIRLGLTIIAAALLAAVVFKFVL